MGDFFGWIKIRYFNCKSRQQCGEIWRGIKPDCLKSSVKIPQSAMVWLAMRSAGVGQLCFLKVTVNVGVYQEVLEQFLRTTVEDMFRDEDFTFQQDLAPPHNSKTTKKWMRENTITVFPWPANSPDFNPIENFWEIVKLRLQGHQFSNLGQLNEAICEMWTSISLEECEPLVRFMPAKIEAVIEKRVHQQNTDVWILWKEIIARLWLFSSLLLLFNKYWYFPKKSNLSCTEL